MNVREYLSQGRSLLFDGAIAVGPDGVTRADSSLLTCKIRRAALVVGIMEELSEKM